MVDLYNTMGYRGPERSPTSRTNLPPTVRHPVRYLDAVRALGGTTGQRILCPRIHRPLADGLFDSESSEEDPELHAGRLQVATHRLSYDGLPQPHEPTPEETRDVMQTLPHTRNV